MGTFDEMAGDRTLRAEARKSRSWGNGSDCDGPPPINWDLKISLLDSEADVGNHWHNNSISIYYYTYLTVYI